MRMQHMYNMLENTHTSHRSMATSNKSAGTPNWNPVTAYYLPSSDEHGPHGLDGEGRRHIRTFALASIRYGVCVRELMLLKFDSGGVMIESYNSIRAATPPPLPHRFRSSRLRPLIRMSVCRRLTYGRFLRTEGRQIDRHMCVHEYTKNNDRPMTKCICADCVCFLRARARANVGVVLCCVFADKMIIV